jgi:hypothetical protein
MLFIAERDKAGDEIRFVGIDPATARGETPMKTNLSMRSGRPLTANY